MKEVTTYLNFDGNCREAMTFYAKCLEAELQVMTFSEVPGHCPEGAADKVMHSSLTKGAPILMASDTMPGMPFQQGNNFSIALRCESVEETEGFFAALGEKGKVMMPLQETFWATRFGALTDQFGINWLFNFEGAKKQ